MKTILFILILISSTCSAQYAVIKDNKVINKVVWNGVTEWSYAFPYDEIRHDPDNLLQPGMEFDGTKWIMPVVRQWSHPEYELRIKAPLELINDHPMLLFKLSVQQKLPLEQEGDTVVIYCHSIAEEDSVIFQLLQEFIKLELK